MGLPCKAMALVWVTRAGVLSPRLPQAGGAHHIWERSSGAGGLEATEMMDLLGEKQFLSAHQPRAPNEKRICIAAPAEAAKLIKYLLGLSVA